MDIEACIFSFVDINVVFMLPFDLEVAYKCNMPVEPTTQTAVEHAAGGIQKWSSNELDIVPNKLGVTFPSTGNPCPLPPSQVMTFPSGASFPLPLIVAVWGAWAGLPSWAAVDGADLMLPGHA